MKFLDELKSKLAEIEVKLNSQQELSEDDMKILFLKNLIEEETGNVSTRKE